MADYTFTAEQADALLERLINDQAFRDLFMDDIAAAFQKLPGRPKPPPGLSPGCCLRPDKLATPEQLRRTREALQGELTSKVNYLPHLFEG